MCGRYSLFTPPEELEERFDARFAFEFEPRYNAAPSQRLPVITGEDPAAIRRLEWGLIPRWADESDEGHINARAETVEEKPAFADAYEAAADAEDHDTPASGRCLVPADGFYEWADTGDGKRPYRVGEGGLLVDRLGAGVDVPLVGRVGPPGHQPPLQPPNRSRVLVRDDG